MKSMLLSALIAVLALTGCATHSLFEEIKSVEYKEYEETVSQILTVPDGKQVAVLGEKYHYIFDTDGALIKAIASELHPGLTAKFGSVDVDRKGHIIAYLDLRLEKGSEQSIAQAKAAGFIADNKGWYKSYSLEGTRYLAGKFTLPEQMQKLNQTYTIKVREAQPIGGKAALALLTPLTVTADGVVILLASPLIVWFVLSYKGIHF
jgi:hypothetical protein